MLAGGEDIKLLTRTDKSKKLLTVLAGGEDIKLLTRTDKSKKLLTSAGRRRRYKVTNKN